MGLAIVAIPEETDRAWKISSEKVPHLTLLFLGEAENADLQQIMQFVEHAVTMSEHGPFYLDVDRRGTLGADEADVLFYNKRSWNLKWVKQFRGQLLQNGAVKTAYDSTEQFDEWQPHLTLGYPETPAKPLPDDGFDHPIYSTAFDRIAVWADNYEGPEFRLEWPDRELEGDLAIAYSDANKAALAHYAKQEGVSEAEYLQHYGTKGMKWGVRQNHKDEPKRGMLDPSGHNKGEDIFKAVVWPLVPPLGIFAIPSQVRLARGAARGANAKATDINEKRFQKHAASAKNFVEIHNRSGEKFNREIQNVNKRHPGDLTKDPKKQAAYDKEAVKLMQDSYSEAAKSIGNRKNTMHLEVKFHNDGQDLSIHAKEGAPTPLPKRVAHAAGIDTEEVSLEITGKILRDETGHITGFTFDGADDTTLMQQEELGELFLAHYGIKGMRWGMRNRKGEPLAITPEGVSRVPHGNRRKTKIKTEGGQNQPAHSDAIKVAESQAKLKKSGTKALSNQELRDVANRLQLENQVKVLTSSKGKKFVKREFETGTEGLARKGIKKGAKKAATAALL